MISEEQFLKIRYRRLATIKAFIDNMTLSDEELAKLLKESGIETSSSTVGRDLTNKEIIGLILEIMPTSDANQIYDMIQETRKKNKEVGNRLGGINYSKNNIPAKDELGKFMGSEKKSL